jgi:hypothetical protein
MQHCIYFFFLCHIDLCLQQSECCIALNFENVPTGRLASIAALLMQSLRHIAHRAESSADHSGSITPSQSSSPSPPSEPALSIPAGIDLDRMRDMLQRAKRLWLRQQERSPDQFVSDEVIAHFLYADMPLKGLLDWSALLKPSK